MKKITFLLALLCILSIFSSCNEEELKNGEFYIETEHQAGYANEFALDFALDQWYYEIDGTADVEGKLGLGYDIDPSHFQGCGAFLRVKTHGNENAMLDCEIEGYIEDFFSAKYHSDKKGHVSEGSFFRNEYEYTMASHYENVILSFSEGEHSGWIATELIIEPIPEGQSGEEFWEYMTTHAGYNYALRTVYICYAKNDRYIVFDEDSVEDAQKKLKSLSS